MLYFNPLFNDILIIIGFYVKGYFERGIAGSLRKILFSVTSLFPPTGFFKGLIDIFQFE